MDGLNSIKLGLERPGSKYVLYFLQETLIPLHDRMHNPEQLSFICMF